MARSPHSKTQPATRFVVMRHNWRPSSGQWYLLPGQARLASYESAAEADADQSRREKAARQRVNPFRFGKDFSERTHMPEPIFLDLVQDLGLKPPAKTKEGRDWAGWWDQQAPAFRPEQRQGLWEPLDRLQFYTV